MFRVLLTPDGALPGDDQGERLGATIAEAVGDRELLAMVVGRALGSSRHVVDDDHG